MTAPPPVGAVADIRSARGRSSSAALAGAQTMGVGSGGGGGGGGRSGTNAPARGTGGGGPLHAAKHAINAAPAAARIQSASLIIRPRNSPRAALKWREYKNHVRPVNRNASVFPGFTPPRRFRNRVVTGSSGPLLYKAP